MQILKFPSKELFEKTKEISVFGPELKVLLDSMFNTMVEAKGIGLAANQVGLPFRMFVMIDQSNERINIVNPTIIAKSLVPANLKEGCLSAPGEILVLNERASWVHLKYQDETGTEQKKMFHGIHAVCVQHETDHLEGKSYLQSKSLHKAKRRELAVKWDLKTK